MEKSVGVKVVALVLTITARRVLSTEPAQGRDNSFLHTDDTNFRVALNNFHDKCGHLE